MQHCEYDDLALAAWEPGSLTVAQDAHVAGCVSCAQELSGLRSTADVIRGTRTLQLTEPPPSLWQGIQRVTAESPDELAAYRTKRVRAPSRARWLPLGVAAAVGLVIGGVFGSSLSLSPDDSPASPQIVASAQLAALDDGPPTQGTGTALFQRTADGADVLVVNTSDLEQASGFYQVWLLDPVTAGLVSVGTVSGGQEQVTLPVPPGVDVSQYSVVDISDEPLDGNPGHSKVSVLRGTLQA